MRFGMELHGEEGTRAVRDAFHGAVVRIAEGNAPVARQSFFTHRIAVVLRREHAACASLHHARLVLSAMAVREFVRGAPRRKPHELAAETNAEDGRSEDDNS